MAILMVQNILQMTPQPQHQILPTNPRLQLTPGTFSPAASAARSFRCQTLPPSSATSPLEPAAAGETLTLKEAANGGWALPASQPPIRWKG